jgi:hypothetical protein|tara:strand:- start:125 stop:295 length:171 start_codon:yes stop_codon:yes gene_type:complete
MFSEEKTCITCGDKFMIHHPAQKRKKYCTDRCSKSWTPKVKKDVLDDDNEKFSGES